MGYQKARKENGDRSEKKHACVCLSVCCFHDPHFWVKKRISGARNVRRRSYVCDPAIFSRKDQSYSVFGNIHNKILRKHLCKSFCSIYKKYRNCQYKRDVFTFCEDISVLFLCFLQGL